MVLTASGSTLQKGKIWYLKQNKIFDGLSPAEMAALDAMTTMKGYEKKQPIFFPGDPQDKVYMLKKGRVKISKLSNDGKEMTLDLLEPGDIFGAIGSGGDGSEEDTYAETMETVSVCIASRDNFEAFLKRNSDLGLRITKFIGFRLKRIENKIESLIFQDVPTRLAHLLLRFAAEAGVAVPSGTMIDIPLTHQDIANLIGSTRETVTELLNRFKRDGLLDFAKRRIVLMDRSALEKKYS